MRALVLLATAVLSGCAGGRITPDEYAPTPGMAQAYAECKREVQRDINRAPNPATTALLMIEARRSMNSCMAVRGQGRAGGTVLKGITATPPEADADTGD